MEYDITLKHMLANDNNIVKKEVQYSLEYLQCKITQCYKGVKYTHLEFEDCKEKCMDKFNKFNLLREILYQDFTKFYYSKFLECSNIMETSKYEVCVEDTKKLMKKNVEDIRKVVNNYNFS
jgi:hypothetical protein